MNTQTQRSQGRNIENLSKASGTSSVDKVVFRICESDADRLKAFQFRYEVYVEEMGRNQRHANHASRTIIEPLDETAIVVGAFKGDEIIGTCRLNFSRDTEFAYSELYDFARFENLYPGKVVFITKLMLKPEFRKGLTFMRFMQELFRIIRIEGGAVNIIDCNDHLVRPFSKLGFQQYQEKFDHPEFGSVTPMVMYNFDTEYFESVRSPLASICSLFNSLESKVISNGRVLKAA